MTDHTHLLLPNYPPSKAATLAAADAQGWAPTPGMSDHEMGAQLRAPHGATGLPRVVHVPVVRNLEPGRGRWGAFWVVAAGWLVLCIVGLCAVAR